MKYRWVLPKRGWKDRIRVHILVRNFYTRFSVIYECMPYKCESCGKTGSLSELVEDSVDDNLGESIAEDYDCDDCGGDITYESTTM